MIMMDKFVVGIYHDNQQYTPKQIDEYIHDTQVEYADRTKMQSLIGESEKKFKSAMDKHRLSLDQILQYKTSEAGRELATLGWNHGNAVVELMCDGAAQRGFLI